MSALRIATPHEPVRLIDLGPSPRPYPLKGTATLRGHLCVPGPGTYKDREAWSERARVCAFRERHDGRVAK